MIFSHGPAPGLSVTGSTSTKQFTTTGYSYDSAGNNTADALNFYTYDAENRIRSAGVGGTYYCFMMAMGCASRRPRQAAACAAVPQHMSCTGGRFPGDTIAETDGSGSTTNSSYNEYVFFAGRRIAQSNPNPGNVYYYFADHLGSTCGAFGSSGPGDYDASADFASGPFAFLFNGFLYGKYYSGTFNTWDQYAGWSTGIAALPESQTYQAFLVMARNLGLDPYADYTVRSQWVAMAYNVWLDGYTVDQSNLGGMWGDPVTFLEGGNSSWYQGYFFDTPHLIGSDPVHAHVDTFGPLNPLHYLIQLPSMLIPSSPQLRGTCAVIGGCTLP